MLTGPHSVQVSLVDGCNYRCVMCWEHSSEFEWLGADNTSREYHANRKIKSTVMDFGVYKSFVRSLRSTGTREISFAGIGEPLLHKKIIDAVSLAKSLGMSVWITTNGSLLTHEMMENLVSAGLDNLNVSINAGVADEYGLVHANQDNSRFPEIVDSLVWLDQYKRQRSISNPHVTMSNVLSSINSHRALEMMQTAVLVGAIDVSYRPIDVSPYTEKYALSPTDMENLSKAFPEADALGKENGISNNISFFYKLLEMRARRGIPSPCFAGWLFPFVLANGDVTFCCTSREVLGNLSERDFASIWYDPARRKLNRMAIRMHKTQEPLPKSRCRGCELMLSNLRIYNRLWPLWGRVHMPSG
ncbi:MAG: radical SAM protein [Thermoleophilia bacterium]